MKANTARAPKADLIPVAEFIRVSTVAQLDKFGKDAQFTKNLSTRDREGLEVKRTFEFDGESGADVVRHPQFRELVAMIERKEISGILANDFSRHMRPERFGDYKFLDICRKHSIVLYLGSGPVDVATKMGRFLAHQLAAMADFERESIRERTTAGRAEALSAGRALCPTSLGVRFDKETGLWSYVDGEGGKAGAPEVKQAFQMFATGTSIRELRSFLGVASTTGVKSILRNEIYTGVIVSNRSHQHKGEDGKWRVEQVPESEWVRTDAKGLIENPLVPMETFNACKVRLKENRATAKRAAYRSAARYNGFVFCPRCHAKGVVSVMTPYHSNAKGVQYDYYVCSRRMHGKNECDQPRIPMVKLETVLDTFIRETLPSEEFAARLAMLLKNQRSAGVDESQAATVSRLEKEQRKLEQATERVKVMFIDGDISRAEKVSRLADISHRLAEVNNELAIARGAVLPEMEMSDIELLFQSLASVPAMPRDDARKVLSVTIPRFLLEYEKNGEPRVVKFYWLLDSKWLNVAAKPSTCEVLRLEHSNLRYG